MLGIFQLNSAIYPNKLKLKEIVEGNIQENSVAVQPNSAIYLEKLKTQGISAHANGGPRSRVCARETLRSAPHRHERKFSGTRFCRVTFKIFENKLKKPKNRPQGARGWGFEFYFFPIIFIIFF